MKIKLPIRQIDEKTIVGVTAPKYEGDAGCDLVNVSDVTLLPKGFTLVRHNFAMELPLGYYGHIYPRSSTISKYRGSLLVMSSPIDSGYRGEIYTMIQNLSDQEIWIPSGTRISQLVIIHHAQVTDITLLTELSKSERNTNGFGSSGT